MIDLRGLLSVQKSGLRREWVWLLTRATSLSFLITGLHTSNREAKGLLDMISRRNSDVLHIVASLYAKRASRTIRDLQYVPGVPTLLKDNIVTTAKPSNKSCNCFLTRTETSQDATVTANLRAAETKLQSLLRCISTSPPPLPSHDPVSSHPLVKFALC